MTFFVAVSVGCQGDRSAPAGRPPGPENFPNRGRLVEELSIGRIEGPAEYVFGFVTDVAIGPGGSIFVADSQAKMVRQYDANGRFVRNFGRVGSGPGEFTGILFLSTHPDGRVLIGDVASGGLRGEDRILVYSSEGEYLQTWSFPGRIEGPVTVDSEGRFYVRLGGEVRSNGLPVTRGGRLPARTSGQPAVANAAGYAHVHHLGMFLTSPGTLRLRPDGTVLDRIPAPPSDPLPYWQPQGTDNRVYMGFWYTPFAWHAWTPLGQLLSGVSSDYSISVHSAELSTGLPLRYLQREMEPVRLATDEMDAIRNAVDEVGSTGWRSVGGFEVPTYKPAYHSVFVSRQGAVWVGVHLPSVRESGGWREPVTAFDVWQPTGEYLGRVEGPVSIFYAVIDGEKLLTWKRDELGVHRVVRYRVEWD